MSNAAKKGATYEGLLNAPSHKVADPIRGTRSLMPRPASLHARASSRLGNVRLLCLLVVVIAAPSLADGWYSPLFTDGNRWVLRTDGKVPFDVDATVAVRAVANAQVALVTFTPQSKPSDDAWVPAPLCLAHTSKGLFVVDGSTCTDQVVKRALKGKPNLSDPPKAYTRAPKPKRDDDVPLKESVELIDTPVLGTPSSVARYAFSQDSGFTVELSKSVGFVTLSWDLQDGGGVLTLQKFIAAK